MNPAGLPFLAGRIVTLRSSPGFMASLVTPCRVSVWTEAVVRIQSVDLALILVRHRELDVRVRIREVQLLEPALEDDLFVQVVHTRHGMMGLESDADHQEASQCDQPNSPSDHCCYSREIECPN